MGIKVWGNMMAKKIVTTWNQIIQTNLSKSP